MQFSPFLRCLDCGVCVAIRLVRFGYNPSTGRIALRVAPISPFPLKGNPRWPRGGGQLDAIDFVTIAIPSLRSLRSRHNLRQFASCATSPAWQLRNRTPRVLVLYVKSDARFTRRRCGSCSVFEYAHSVNKCAPNKHSPWISVPWISERQKDRSTSSRSAVLPRLLTSTFRKL